MTPTRYFIYSPQNTLLLELDATGRWGVPAVATAADAARLPGDGADRAVDISDFAGSSARCYATTDAGAADADAARTTDTARRAWFTLRDAWRKLPADDFRTACHASVVASYDASTRLCPTCGTRLDVHPDVPTAKRCPHCHREIFPPVSPAMIVRIERRAPAGIEGVAPGTPQILMVHARNFRDPSTYGLVAGFVQPGETIEECVEREVREETSLAVSDIRYFGSSPWPFPSSLMVAFTAQYAGGDIRLADGELSDARWCDAAHMPASIPHPMSIARRLIDDWLQRQTDDEARD